MDKILMLIRSWLRHVGAPVEAETLDRLPLWLQADLPTFHPREP